MRIEGTYTVPAPIDQVFAALTHPDMLSQIIPGCERLVQLGPAVGDWPPVYEVRLRRGPGADVYALTLTLSTLQSPTHIRADLEGRGPNGPFSGHGMVTFAPQDAQTEATSVWEVKSPVLAGLSHERQTEWNKSVEQFSRALCDRAASVIHSPMSAPTGARRQATPRGWVVILPRDNTLPSSDAQAVAKRVAWMGGGILAGLVGIWVVVAIVRRLAGVRARDDSGSGSA